MARNLTTGLQRGLRRSIAGGLGASDLFSVASLDLRFAQTKTLDPRITFTRASSGTYVSSDGLIKTATTNLLLRSEEFGTWWTALRASVSANTITAPNGSLTADTLIEDTTATNSHQIYSGSAQGAGTYTVSIYAKAAGRSVFQIQQESGGNSRFTLTGNGTAEALGANTVSITSVGNGWYRCTSTYTATGAHLIYLVLHNGTTTFYTGDGTSGIYLWGAQLEQSSTVGEYIPTTSTINSAPRFDHNPTTGESLGLLVEEQRTNLLLRSEEFDNASWAKNASSITANATVAPDGKITADKIVENTSNAQHGPYQNYLATSTTLTLSVFLKAAERTAATILISNFSTDAAQATINLSTGAVSNVTSAGTDYTNVSASATSVGNGWYRCVITATKGTANTINQSFIVANNGSTSSYTGDGTSGIYVWGAQLEAGSFPTSYIPTTTATVTRSADVASITGANFSSWYNQTEGTVFTQAAGIQTQSGSDWICAADDGSANNRIMLSLTNSGDGRSRGFVSVGSGGAALADMFLGATPYVSNTSRKGAYSYKVSDYGFCVDGGTTGSNAQNSVPSGITTLRIGQRIGIGSGGSLNGTIRRLTYFPIRLPNATLQQITR